MLSKYDAREEAHNDRGVLETREERNHDLTKCRRFFRSETCGQQASIFLKLHMSKDHNAGQPCKCTVEGCTRRIVKHED